MMLQMRGMGMVKTARWSRVLQRRAKYHALSYHSLNLLTLSAMCHEMIDMANVATMAESQNHRLLVWMSHIDHSPLLSGLMV